MVDVASLVDMRTATQSRKIFFDRDVYQLELERIFGRCWLFLTHESAIPRAGDFARARMGEDEVVVVRQRDASFRAFINSCRHRGAMVCPAEAGNTRGFVCSYHGWSYGLDGRLEGVPFEKELYRGGLDKASHGLVPVTKVESFNGFVYGCFDPGAPSLRDYLGEMAWYLEIWMDANGGVDLVGPPTRSILHCNWKTPAENFGGDAYHVGWTHAAALRTLGGPLAAIAGNAALPPQGSGLQIAMRHGHGMGILYDAGCALLGDAIPDVLAWQAQKRAVVEKKLGPTRARFYVSHLNSTIFPNNSFLWGTNTWKVWIPRGPTEIEVLSWTIVEKDMPDELKAKLVRSMHRTFGTAGMLEADDSDNMETMTNLNQGFFTGQGRINCQMGLGGDHEDPELPGVVGDSGIGETSYRGYYRFYQEILAAKSWSEIRQNDAHWKTALIGAQAPVAPVQAAAAG